MNRVWQKQSEAVAQALRYVPDRFLEVAGFDLFCGDPLFAQLYKPRWTLETNPTTGLSYRELCHCGYEHNTKDGRTTVVLPYVASPMVVVHEIGHVLNERIQARAGGWHKIPRLEVVSEYATVNRYEEFAEAFTVYCGYWPEYLEGQSHFRWSDANAEWFKRLLRP